MVQSRPLQDFINPQKLLDAFRFILPEEQILNLIDTDPSNPNPRHKIPPQRAVQLLLGMAWYRNLAVDTVWTKLFSSSDAPPSAPACHYARERLGQLPKEIFKQLCRPMADPHRCPEAFHNGWRLMALDGSSFAMPDSPANGKRFGHVKNQNGLSGYPQLQMVALCELATHAIVAYRLGRARAAEVPLAEKIVAEDLQPGCLILADRLYFSYKLLKNIRARDCHALFRLKTKQLKLPVEKVLSDGSYQTTIYPNEGDRKQGRNGMVVRIIESTRSKAGAAGQERTIRLLTTLSVEELSAADALGLYWGRWEQELVFGEIKVDLLQNQKVPLRSRQAELVEQEIEGVLMAHWLVRWVMYQAAVASGTPVLRLSFKRSWQSLLDALRLGGCRSWDVWWAELVRSVSRHKLPARRKRSYKRSTKQPRSKWPRHKENGEQPTPEHWTIPDHRP